MIESSDDSKVILAIDPGTTESAWVLYSPEKHWVIDKGIEVNEVVNNRFRGAADEFDVAIEMVACYGMPVGAETFETCLWIGRFIESFGGGEKVYRKDVKMHLCQSMRAKDANIRQSLLDSFGAVGGGSTPQVGTKKQPGPLYGVKSHIWSALAVAVTFAGQKQLEAC